MTTHFLFTGAARKLCMALAAISTLSACLPGDTEARLKATAEWIAKKECSAAQGRDCYFVNSPVKLGSQPVRMLGRAYVFFRTAEPLRFFDAFGRDWTAPKLTLTDGASIPVLFVPFVGSPRTPEFANAAALHDAYCGVGNEGGPNWHNGRWQDVHRMFYDTLVAGGTPLPKAKLMFAAVWLGGPRWDKVEIDDWAWHAKVPEPLKLSAFMETRNFIVAKKPNIAQLIKYLQWQDLRMKWAAPDYVPPKDDRPPFDPNTSPITTPPGPGGAVQPPVSP